MKKVGLVCVTYKDNFGSALQTYATQRAIEEMGFKTGIFDISGVHNEINKRKKRFYLKRIFHKDEFKYLWENFISRGKIKKNSSSDEYAVNMSIRHKKYEEFNEKYLHFLSPANSWEDLSHQSEGFDCIVVGSDQLWRPSNIAGGYFTLDFVPDNIKKVAYATSFGVSVIPKSLHKATKKFIERIDYVSIREETGKAIIKNLVGRDVPVVCDPTMLFNSQQWMDIQEKSPIVSGDYVLCYFLGDNSEHRDFVRKLKKETGWKIVALLHGAVYIPSDDQFPDEAPYNIGPGDFINLIRYSKVVCTDSFHGTVFSILNKKPFFAFRRYEDSSQFSTNDRIKTLLEWTGLDSRLIFGTESVDSLISMKIDYDSVTALIEKKRAESFNYLKSALFEDK